jgi:hypothetical protein
MRWYNNDSGGNSLEPRGYEVAGIGGVDSDTRKAMQRLNA